ncbi:MAG: hemerythrin domain-containing protein [Burkholderiaceae bacterium]
MVETIEKARTAAMAGNLRSASGGTARDRAVATVLREHRLLASVLILLDAQMAEIVEGNKVADFTLLATILCYIDAFPDRFHHPKEDRYLFSALREAAARDGDQACIDLIDRCSNEHRISTRLLSGLERCFIAFQARLPGATSAFVDACAAYTRYHLDHMQAEENELIPRAIASLTDAHWAEIAVAFDANEDPFRGAEPRRAYDRLRKRIIDLLPERERAVMLQAEADADALGIE